MNRDFEDLLRALSAARAEYLVVGGYAVGFHTEPRYTKDLDVWVRPTPANARRVWAALKAFGAPLANLRLKDLSTRGIIFQIGVEPNRVDVLTDMDGVDFATAWQRRATGPFGDVEVNWLAPVDLIANKRAVGRPQDLLDVKKLQPLVRRPARTRRAPK